LSIGDNHETVLELKLKSSITNAEMQTVQSDLKKP